MSEPQSQLGSASRPLRVAIIGAGPAGFFAAGALLKTRDVNVSIDIFDRLPTPYGLVRYGVAPDHQKIKKVRAVFAKTAQDPRVRFFGGVGLGTSLSYDALRAHYDQVLYSVGAQSDRRLGIEGEDLAGSYSATEFVAWYNSHPDYADRVFPLDHKVAVVIGAGNVALDVARILAKSTEELSTSDIADHSLRALAESSVEDVYILARRGPVQAKFSNPELKEFGTLEVCAPVVSSEDMTLDAASEAALEAGSKTTRRNVEILRSFVGASTEGKPRRVHFRFLTSPVALLSEDGERVSAVQVVRNELRPTDSGYLQSYPTEVTETIPAGLVLRSVGYRGVPLAGVPFHERWAIIPNDGGRVLEHEGGAHRVGEYVAGWAKRGPSGVIGTNKSDASETVRAMIEDLEKTPAIDDARAALEAIPALLIEKGVRFISFEDWKRVEDVEVARGAASGRPRVKFARREDILAEVDRG